MLPVSVGGPPQLRLTVQIEEQAKPSAAGAAMTKPEAARRRPAATTLPERYLTSREVDTPARPRGNVPLLYPENPLIWKLRGVVRMRLLINEQGAVDSAEFVHAQPPGEFEEAALEAARRLRYDPAGKNGRPVKSQKLIEVTFDPYEKPPAERL